MDKKALEFFKKLMAIPTPTGFEMEGQRLVAERVKPRRWMCTWIPGIF